MQEYLGLLIAVARRLLKQAVLARASQHRLSVQQFWMLIGLKEHPGMSQGQIAEQVHADAPTVSRTLAALERRGLVRTTEDPSDRRRTLAVLTPSGRRLATLLEPAAIEVRKASVSGMSDTEIEAVRQGLSRVIANVEGFLLGATPPENGRPAANNPVLRAGGPAANGPPHRDRP